MKKLNQEVHIPDAMLHSLSNRAQEVVVALTVVVLALTGTEVVSAAVVVGLYGRPLPACTEAILPLVGMVLQHKTYIRLSLQIRRGICLSS